MTWFGAGRRSLGKQENVDREIAFHVEELTDANVAKGMAPAEARRRALVELGGVEQVEQQVREVHLSAAVESLRANLRSAWRFVGRYPSFAAVVVMTLGLGIGANSAVFSAIDAILLRPLSFSRGDELVEVQQQNVTKKSPQSFVAPIRLEDWAHGNSTFQALSGYYTQSISLKTGDLPEKITEAFVSSRFLKVWGVKPKIGRDFTEAEETFGGPAAVFISERFWRSHLDADPKVIGRAVHGIGTVVAVLPSSFRFPDRDVDLWSPSPADAPYANQNRDATWYSVTGRLKPGVTVEEQAQADLATVQTQLGKQFPKSDGDLTVVVRPLKAVMVRGVGNSLWVLYGAVTVLLLIACTNIAALLMARTAEREHEISIRYSLGASRAAIVIQLLTEVFVLAVGGSLFGLLMATAVSHVFGALAKALPRADEIALNWRILVYSLTCAVVTTMLCGLLPAIRGTRGSLSGAIAHSGPNQVSVRNRWQSALIGVQVSLAVALLIGAGLLLRSFRAIGQVQPGFESGHVLTMRVSGGWDETADMGKLKQRINRTLDGLRAVPGVVAAATTATIPGNSEGYPTELKITEGSRDPNERVIANSHFVSGGYFAAMQIPMLAGEPCRDGDPTDAVMVNRSFAEKYLEGAPPIGYHLSIAATNGYLPSAVIHGVVGDAREEGLDKVAQPSAYWCNSAPTPDPHYVIRTQGDPMAMARTLRLKVHELEPARSVFNVMPLEDHLDASLADNRLRTELLTFFALTAIVLVSIGLYGTISYLVRTRRKEVGLRLALGALPKQITRRFLFRGLCVTLIGCAAGLLLAAALSRLLKGMLYGVTSLDPLTYVAVLLLTLAVAAAASFVPAVRASRVEPTEVLREL